MSVSTSTKKNVSAFLVNQMGCELSTKQQRKVAKAAARRLEMHQRIIALLGDQHSLQERQLEALAYVLLRKGQDTVAAHFFQKHFAQARVQLMEARSLLGLQGCPDYTDWSRFSTAIAVLEQLL